MKERDRLQITTLSIKEFLEHTFRKKASNILICEFLSISALTIDGQNEYGKRTLISFQDLKPFKNLKYLEIRNTLITVNIINILAQFNYLETIILKNCDLSQKITTFNKLYFLKSLRITKCSNFNIKYISNMPNIKRLFLSKIDIDNIYLPKLKLDSLDISEANLKDFTNINKLNVKYLTINHSQYLNNKNIFNNECKFKILVIADDGYYIEKWIN